MLSNLFLKSGGSHFDVPSNSEMNKADDILITAVMEAEVQSCFLKFTQKKLHDQIRNIARYAIPNSVCKQDFLSFIKSL